MFTETPIKVRYGETDMMGVVYHANYLLYFEDARLDFLEALDFCYAERIEEAGYMSPILAVDVRYNSPLRYGEQGFVRTSVCESKPMKTVYHQQVYRAGEGDAARPLVDAYVTVCVVERESFKPVNIKRAFPGLYQAYAEVLEGSDA